ncbi:unnamed protein product [Linum trigynum]|uniref:Uncharacterized protein n=1 Tax=Linum trigynum TaxID=586398 RepID=A0AAV2GBK2_9ROSI
MSAARRGKQLGVEAEEEEAEETVVLLYRFRAVRVYFFVLISFFLLRRLIAPTYTVRTIAHIAQWVYVPFFIYLQLGYFNILHLSKTAEEKKKGVVVWMVQLLLPASMRTVHTMEFRLTLFLLYIFTAFTIANLMVRFRDRDRDRDHESREEELGGWVDEPDVVFALSLFAGYFIGINRGIGFVRHVHYRRDYKYGDDYDVDNNYDDGGDDDCNDYLLLGKRRRPKPCPQAV